MTALTLGPSHARRDLLARRIRWFVTATIAWQVAGRDPEARERIALRVIASAFFGLALLVGVGAVRTLLGTAEARPSTVGLVLAAVSLVIMPVLSYGQRRAGRELGSQSAVADSHQTLLCTYLSAVLLVGLGLNAWLGWSWADPLVALVIAGIAVREGIQAWRGEVCCARPTAGTGTPDCACCADDDGRGAGHGS